MKSFFTKTFRSLTAAIAVAFTPAVVQAADSMAVADVTAVTPLTVLDGGNYEVKSVLFVNSSTNSATVKFYDSDANDTNYVRAATSTYAPVASVLTTTFTNSAGIVITNTFTGVSIDATAVSANTNAELPAIIGPFIVTGTGTPAFSARLLSTRVNPTRGLTIYSTQSGTVEVTYETR